MAREEKLKDVPGERLGTVVQSFSNDGAKEIRAVKNNIEQTWDVTAHFD